MVSITNAPIDIHKGIRDILTPEGGAINVFLGTTRDHTDGRKVVELEYEAYEPMALAVMQKLVHEAERRWPLHGVNVFHRTGRVPRGESSVLVAVASSHRAEAFEACRWLIDRLKHDVPIWKREHFEDGTTSWVLPTELRTYKAQEA